MSDWWIFFFLFFLPFALFVVFKTNTKLAHWMHRHRLETTRTDGRRNGVVVVELQKAPAAMPRRAACSMVVYPQGLVCTSSQNIGAIYSVDGEVARRRWKEKKWTNIRVCHSAEDERNKIVFHIRGGGGDVWRNIRIEYWSGESSLEWEHTS